MNEAPKRIFIRVDCGPDEPPFYTVKRMIAPQVEYLKATSAAHWVSVKDRLPEEGSRFIVTDGALFYLSTYEDGNFWEVGHVSHWLSNVPSIPTEEK